jgi:hypothetical protein
MIEDGIKRHTCGRYKPEVADKQTQTIYPDTRRRFDFVATGR